MKLAIICFSLTGCETGEKISSYFEQQGYEIRFAKKSRYIPDAEPVNVDEWTRTQFAWADSIIFVGACGIAVRHIAPYIRSKKTDPAVLAVDECGLFVISLLSGHLGGANELTQVIAEILGATPVVTTATDLHHRFAVDVFARKNGCDIFHMEAAKAVSAALLAGKKVGFYSDFPIEGELPEGLVLCNKYGRECIDHMAAGDGADKLSGETEKDLLSGRKYEIGIAVTIYRNRLPFAETTTIVPKNVVLGMGCKKDTDAKTVRKAAQEAVAQGEIYRQSICKLTSIDLKKEEKGLLDLAEKWSIPFETYMEEELKNVSGTFTASLFVKAVTGVDNVCERSAVLGSENGCLIQKKTGRNGVTTALAVKDWRIRFE